MIKEILKGIWAFCSYLFVPQKETMKITQVMLNSLTEQAKASERLRMNLDLRNSDTDGS